MMRKTFLIAASAVAALVVIGVASAHVGTTPDEAPAGQTSVIGFIIGHGCEGSPTRSVTIRIPAGVTATKPRPKAGWNISIKRGTLPKPVKDFDGNTLRTGVLEVTWSGGRLLDSWYDTFELRLGMPNTPGKMLWFPTVQRCVKGVHRWIAIPQGTAGARGAGTRRQARQVERRPRLDVLEP